MTAPDTSPLTPHAVNTTVLAFDFGEKRIGVAVGDLALRIAHPLTTIHAEDNATRFAEIGKLVTEWRPVRLIVGLPMHADGTEHEVSRLARRFAHRLEGRFGRPVELVDERLTSVAAESRLRESGARRDEIEASLDAAAAREILDSYFAAAQRSSFRTRDSGDDPESV
jgi:putative Holliday junction resolvase